MNDLNLGWNEVGSAVQGLASTPFRAHATPKLHPALISAGMSLLDIKAKSGLTIFSANGATIKHCNFNLKSTSNIIVRNLKFDENWEWDEATKGDYDSNDWDFMTLGNGGAATNIWIDHCTFTKAYDGIVDQKKTAANITISWCKYVGDDGATNPNSFVRQQINALEANKSAYAFYNFLRTHGFSVENIVQIIQGHDKTHLMGSNALDSGNATLAATFHHLWLNNVWDRCVPRLRAGNVHDYNLYVDDSLVLTAHRLRDTRAAAMTTADQNTLNNTYSFNPPVNGSISTEGGAVLVEKSVYLDCLWPLRNNQTDVTDPQYTGKIEALDTIYTFHNTDGSTTNVRGNSTDAGNPMGPFQAPVITFSWNGFSSLPYAYTPEDPASLLSSLQAGAGAGVLTWSKDNWLKTSY
jgi:pectate lyase